MRRPIQIRRGTAAEWTAANPILRPGELGLETDTGLIKTPRGRVATRWNSISGYTNARNQHMRAAAWSGKGSSSTDGAFASYTWDASQDVRVGGMFRSAVAPSGTLTLLGNSGASSWNLRVTVNGALEFRENATQRALSADGVVAFDGKHRLIEAAFTGTTVAIYVEGVSVATGTFSSVTWASQTVFIGAGGAGVGIRWPGLIYNVQLTDNLVPANSATLLLDEPMSSTTYANSYSGTTAAATATKGTNAAAPWTTAVVSTDGRGMPWQMGSGGAVVYGSLMDTAVTGITGVTARGYTGATLEQDPTGSLSTGTWTAPCAGTFVAIYRESITATTLGAARDIQMRLAAPATNYNSTVTLAAANVYATVTVQACGVATAGQTVIASLQGLNAADTYTVAAGSTFTVLFTPTPVAS